MATSDKTSEYFRQCIDGESETVVVTFGGCGKAIGSILPFEFLNTMNKHFTDVDAYFYVDHNASWYNKGLLDMTSSIEETADLIRERVSPYKRKVFIGNSAGGYASLLFGSLLKAETVVSFIPQTSLTHIKKTAPRTFNVRNIDTEYMDIIPYMNKTTDYHVYRRPSGPQDALHKVYHVDRIAELEMPNVSIHELRGDLKSMKNRGELIPTLSDYIYA